MTGTQEVTSEFWQEHGLKFAAPNAAKALRRPVAGPGAVSEGGDLNAEAAEAAASDGATRSSCEVAAAPQPGIAVRFDSAVALLEGRWATVERDECYVCDQENDASRLRVFEVPGQRLAAHGWVGSFGGPSGDCRPVP